MLDTEYEEYPLYKKMNMVRMEKDEQFAYSKQPAFANANS